MEYTKSEFTIRPVLFTSVLSQGLTSSKRVDVSNCPSSLHHVPYTLVSHIFIFMDMVLGGLAILILVFLMLCIFLNGCPQLMRVLSTLKKLRAFFRVGMWVVQSLVLREVQPSSLALREQLSSSITGSWY